MIHNGRRISTIIFDWSGTLSDDRQMVFEANLHIRRQHGFAPIDFDTFLANIKLTAPEALAEMGLSGTKEELQTLYTKAVESVKSLGVHPTAYSDAAITLERLVAAGLNLAVLSSHPDEHLLFEAQSFGFEQHFHHISGDCHDKAIGILAILDLLGVRDRASVAYVGDTIYDIRAAKVAGVVSVGITTGYMNAVRLMMEEPDLLFYSLSDLGRLY